VTGAIIADTGERQGAVIPVSIESDFNIHPALRGRTLENTGIKELDFGHRKSEFDTIGTYRINPETEDLIIYPLLQLKTDRDEIPVDGTAVATITATITDPNNTDPVTFQVTNTTDYVSTPVEIIPQNGEAVFELVTFVPGNYTVSSKHVLYGQTTLQVKGVSV